MRSPLRILMVSDVSASMVEGGAERVLWEQAARLTARRDRVCIVSRSTNDGAAEAVEQQGVSMRHFPVDRHIFAKRLRVWANANGFISALNAENLLAFEPGPPARWRFATQAGDGDRGGGQRRGGGERQHAARVVTVGVPESDRRDRPHRRRLRTLLPMGHVLPRTRRGTRRGRSARGRGRRRLDDRRGRRRGRGRRRRLRCRSGLRLRRRGRRMRDGRRVRLRRRRRRGGRRRVGRAREGRGEKRHRGEHSDEAHPTLHQQNPGLSPDPPRVYAAKARIASGIVSLTRGRSSMVEP